MKLQSRSLALAFFLLSVWMVSSEHIRGKSASTSSSSVSSVSSSSSAHAPIDSDIRKESVGTTALKDMELPVAYNQERRLGIGRHNGGATYKEASKTMVKTVPKADLHDDYDDDSIYTETGKADKKDDDDEEDDDEEDDEEDDSDDEDENAIFPEDFLDESSSKSESKSESKSKTMKKVKGDGLKKGKQGSIAKGLKKDSKSGKETKMKKPKKYDKKDAEKMTKATATTESFPEDYFGRN